MGKDGLDPSRFGLQNDINFDNGLQEDADSRTMLVSYRYVWQTMLEKVGEKRNTLKRSDGKKVNMTCSY